MNSDAPAQAQPKHVDDSGGNMFLFAAAGIGIYVALKILDPSIAFPLRQISSSLATWFLNALSIPCTLEGTAISTSTFIFDVNPDCSGSTSLRIMLTLGALWFGMYPNLTLWRRVICLALAAPIAIACNAVRVTALVMLGHGRGEPVEGFPHELVGILSFGLSMGVVYLMTLLMAKEPEVVKRFGPRAHAVILILALGVCYAPVLAEPIIGDSDISVSVVHSVFVVLGLCILLFSNKRSSSLVRPWIPLAGFGLSLAVLFYGTMTDVLTLASLSFIGVLLSLVLYFRGWSATLRSTLLGGVVFIGLPGMHNFWIRRALGFSEPDGYLVQLLLESFLAAILIAAFLLLGSKRLARVDGRGGWVQPRFGAIPTKAFILAAFAGVLFQTYFNSQAATFDRVHRIEIPLVIGEWKGVELEPSAQEISVLGRERIVSRTYHRREFEVIHLLANATGADRNRAHRPELCMINSGWAVTETEETTHVGRAGATPMTLLRLQRGGEELEMRYWLADPDGTIYGNIAALRPVDVTRRLTGRRTDWRVFRVFSRPGSPGVGDFLDNLLPTQSSGGLAASPD